MIFTAELGVLGVLVGNLLVNLIHLVSPGKREPGLKYFLIWPVGMSEGYYLEWWMIWEGPANCE